MGIADQYRRKKAGNNAQVLVSAAAVGVVLVALAVVLVIVSQSSSRNARPAKRTHVIAEDPKQTALRFSGRALANRGIVRVQSEALVTKYGPDTWSVSGTCLVDDQPALYTTVLRVDDQRWSPVSLTVNGVQLLKDKDQ